MTDLEGEDLEFDLGIDNYLKNYKVIATGKNLHDPVMDLIRKI